MSETEKQWQQMRDKYLRQIEDELTAVRHPNKKELLADVRDHLERKFEELDESDQTEPHFSQILEEMGPAEEYAELLAENPPASNSQMPDTSGQWPMADLILTVLFIIVFVGVLINLFLNKAHTQAPDRGKIQQVMEDFEPDPELVGRWIRVDFVADPKYFIPGKQQSQNELSLKELIFYEDGRTSGPWIWTRDTIYHPGSDAEAHYEIKTLEGHPYLFFEWISGDVTIRGMKPKYYVLVKED